jgi:hypothetical protein
MKACFFCLRAQGFHHLRDVDLPFEPLNLLDCFWRYKGIL